MLFFRKLAHHSVPSGSSYSKFKILSFVAILVVVTIFSMLHTPVRNVVYKNYMRNAWYDVRTQDIIRMRYFRPHEPEDFTAALQCDASTTRNASTLDIDLPKAVTTNRISTAQTHGMLRRGLGRYLPTLREDQKSSTLLLYLALANALEARGISFFLTAGSLLGLVRHGGFIPWDDDFDIGIDVNNMTNAHKALGCVPGVELFRFADFHWKFQYQGQDFPYLDLFMYDKDDRYVWSLTWYITNTFVYLHHHVFPLTTAQFEGRVTVPVPAKALQVVKRIYGYDDCVAYTGHIKVNQTWRSLYPNGYSLTDVPCRRLSEFYSMNYLE